MTTTAPRVTFGLYDLTFKSDATLTTPSDLQAFSKVDDLRTDNVNARPYASYEPDFWLLDGEYKFLPADTAAVHVGVVSLDMSDADGDFSTPPVIEIEFGEAHDLPGLSLRFSPYTGDYADSITVDCYDDVGLLQSDNYTPDDTEFSTETAVDGVTQIIITFNSTNRPYRFLRVQGIDYGSLIVFEGADIQGATVVEEIDPLTAELRVNTLELQLYSEDAQFSLLNPAGDYAALAEHQPINLYEVINGVRVFMGQYFLDTWENTSDRQITMHCVDLIGLMDTIPDYGGLWTGAGTPVQNLLTDIMGAANIPYELDDALLDSPIIGWIPVGTLRETLQHIAFAIGATVDCSRAWAVRIYAMPWAVALDAVATLTAAQKGAEQMVSLKPAIAGVVMTAHTYEASMTAGIRGPVNGTLAAGTYEIIFDDPLHDLNVSNATITASGANYAILSVASELYVNLGGYLYEHGTQIVTVDNPEVASNIRPALRITDATLIHPDNVDDVSQRVFDYYQQRLVQKVRLYAPLIEVGQVVLVDTLYGGQICAVVEKMEIDLGRGMVAQVEMTGVKVE